MSDERPTLAESLNLNLSKQGAEPHGLIKVTGMWECCAFVFPRLMVFFCILKAKSIFPCRFSPRWLFLSTSQGFSFPRLWLTLLFEDVSKMSLKCQIIFYLLDKFIFVCNF